jgi:hypothetical protein
MVAQVSTSISSNARALGKSRRDVHSIRIFCNGSFSLRALEMDLLPPAPFFQCQMEPEARQVPTARALTSCSSHGSRHEGKERPWLAWSNCQSYFSSVMRQLFLFSSSPRRYQPSSRLQTQLYNIASCSISLPPSGCLVQSLRHPLRPAEILLF